MYFVPYWGKSWGKVMKCFLDDYLFSAIEVFFQEKGVFENNFSKKSVRLNSTQNP